MQNNDNSYFDDVVSNLDIDDMSVLGVLYDNEATAKFKSMNTQEVIRKTGLTESTLRRIVYKISGSKFIQIAAVKKQHKLFITQYGIDAVCKSAKEVETG